MALDGPQAAVAAVLSRGHTIDRLNSSELQEIVKQIESLNSKLQDENNAIEPATKKPKQGSEQLSDKKEDDEGKEQENKPEDKNNEGEANKAEAVKADPKAESKEQRKKRLHARFMRFSRSLVSHVLIMFMSNMQLCKD